MVSTNARGEAVTERKLCTTVAEDGLRCQPAWPNCISEEKCREEGCYWRKWHQIPRDQMMPRVDPLLL